MFNAVSNSEWVYQAPRWRTVLLPGGPLRLFWPHLAFLKTAPFLVPLHAFALDGPVASEADLVEKLRFFPFTAFTSMRGLSILDMSHIDGFGRVCFNDVAISLISDGNDPVDVFWNSGFSVFNADTLRAWRAASEADVVALRPFSEARPSRECQDYVRRSLYSRAPWLPGELRGDDALVPQA